MKEQRALEFFCMKIVSLYVQVKMTELSNSRDSLVSSSSENRCSCHSGKDTSPAHKNQVPDGVLNSRMNLLFWDQHFQTLIRQQ